MVSSGLEVLPGGTVDPDAGGSMVLLQLQLSNNGGLYNGQAQLLLVYSEDIQTLFGGQLQLLGTVRQLQLLAIDNKEANPPLSTPSALSSKGKNSPFRRDFKDFVSFLIIQIF